MSDLIKRRYFGPAGSQIHAREKGEGTPLVLLPPAPHTGAFFETLMSHLSGFKMTAFDYPGYGGSDRISSPSVAGYAGALLPYVPDRSVLVGFHTGNLIAAEIARLNPIRQIMMIDVPFFDEDTRQNYAGKLPPDGFLENLQPAYDKAIKDRHDRVSEDRAYHLWVEGLRSGLSRSDAFRAAFAYDPKTGLKDLPCPVHLVATQSSLLERTREAAAFLSSPLTECLDVTAPAFEAHAKRLSALITQISQESS